MSKVYKNITKFFKGKLAHRLSLYFTIIAILCSVCVAALTSYVQYQRDLVNVDKDVKQLADTIEAQVINHLWSVDRDSLTLLLEGVNRLPVVKGVKVVDDMQAEIILGSSNDHTVVDKPLFYEDKKVGSLTVYANREIAVNRLLAHIINLSISAALVFILLGFVFFTIVKRTITNHLSAISQMTLSPEYYRQKDDYTISLDRKYRDDELSTLVGALNAGLDKSRELAEAKGVYETRLHTQAYRDDLTGMPNRRDADQYIARSISEVLSSKSARHLMIFFIDLDNFKDINDSFGHTVGDNILLDSSERFKKIIQKYDGYIARFGGDEFIGCVQCESYIKGEIIAQSMVDEVNRHFNVENMTLTLSCSMGVVFCPEHAQSAEDVIRKADAAMYRAKEVGRNGFVIYDEDIMNDVLLHNNIKQRIKKALHQSDDLTIHYQPLINIKENTIIGFEALLRWQDDILGHVSPEVFIPIAEKTGLIFDIDTMVFDNAMAQVEQWRKAFNKNFKVSVNFSPTNFENSRIDYWLKDKILPRKNLEWVELEVTERLILRDDASVKDLLNKISASGVRLSLDDFGTGFSSLGYIKKFNTVLSKIKIDRLFVNEIMHSEADLALVKSIITMVESLGIEWLAEGVETRAQLDKLESLGCEFVQGFYYAKPMCAEEVEAFIENWEVETA